jgi:hypothetical protein
MMVLRGIVFSVLLVFATLVAVAGVETVASASSPAVQLAAGHHAATAVVHHCDSAGISATRGASRDDCCRDMNCGGCAHSTIAVLYVAGVAASPRDTSENAAIPIRIFGRNIAPDTGPPKSFA